MTALIGFTAPSGSGKTTLVEQVITHLTRAGVRVAALKHGHHSGDPDQPGKDSYRMRKAGSATVIFSGPERWFMIQERGGVPLEEHLKRLEGHDLIVVEGFKGEPGMPRIALYRREVAPPGPWTEPPGLIAVASDDPELPATVPLLPLNDPARVARFVMEYFGLAALDGGEAR